MKTGGEYLKRYRMDILLAAVLCGIFAVLCLYRLLTGGEYSGDEFFSLEDTLGYAYTGQKLKWDFHTLTVMERAAKINPYFYLLAGWVRLVGTGEVALRSLSTLLGLCAVLSFYYMVRRMTGSREWAFLAGLLLCLNYEIVTVSTFVRGYALLLLLFIWFFYLLYRALNGRLDDRRTYIYGLAALALFYIAYQVRSFSFLYLLGIGVYIEIRALLTKEKKFVITGGIFWLAVILVVLMAALRLDQYIPALGFIVGRLQKYGGLGIRNLQYWKEIGSIFSIIPVTVAGLILAVYYVCGRGEGQETGRRDAMLYMLSVFLPVVIAFTTFVDWGHNTRYFIAVYPAVVMAAVGGFCTAARRMDRRDKGLFYGLLCVCMTMNLPAIFFVNAEEREDFSGAYQTVAEYAAGEPVFITGMNLRGYYARDVIPGYIWQPMTSKGSDPDIDHLEEICEIGREHPQGVITCEDSRWYHFRNSFWLLLNQDAFQRLTGDGVDDTNVGNWAYHMAYPSDGAIAEKDRTVTIFGVNFGGASHIEEAADQTVLELELNGSVSELTLLCIRLNQYLGDGEKRERLIQLVLEPNGNPSQYYRIILDNDDIPVKSILGDAYYIYTGGQEPKAYEDCYTL